MTKIQIYSVIAAANLMVYLSFYHVAKTIEFMPIIPTI